MSIVVPARHRPHQRLWSTRPSEVFSDIYVRFFGQLPAEEAAKCERMMMALREAHWYFEDWYAEAGLCPHLSMSDFTARFLDFAPHLNPAALPVRVLLGRLKEYLLEIPVYGCILLSHDLSQCLLVQQALCPVTTGSTAPVPQRRRRQAACSWGFPKGKVDRGESPEECALREVFEETGVRLEPAALRPDLFLQTQQRDGRGLTRLYLVLDVEPEAVKPCTEHSCKEIAAVRWWPVGALPRLARSSHRVGQQLLSWVDEERRRRRRQQEEATAPTSPPAAVPGPGTGPGPVPAQVPTV